RCKRSFVLLTVLPIHPLCMCECTAAQPYIVPRRCEHTLSSPLLAHLSPPGPFVPQPPGGSRPPLRSPPGGTDKDTRHRSVQGVIPVKIALVAEHANPLPAHRGEPSCPVGLHACALSRQPATLGQQTTVYYLRRDPDQPEGRTRMARGVSVTYLDAGP